MNTTKKNQKPNTKAALPAKKTAATPGPALAKKTPEQVAKEFAHIVDTASAWCGDHGVSLAVAPVEAMLLKRQRDAIGVAVVQAGGPEKVPVAVLVYQQTLDDAANFIVAHGFERVIHLLSGKGL